MVKDKIKQLLAEKEMTQTKLAELAGVTSVSISRYASGERYPTAEIVKRIADAFDVTVEYLTAEGDPSDDEYKVAKRAIQHNIDTWSDEQKKELLEMMMGKTYKLEFGKDMVSVSNEGKQMIVGTVK